MSARFCAPPKPQAQLASSRRETRAIRSHRSLCGERWDRRSVFLSGPDQLTKKLLTGVVIAASRPLVPTQKRTRITRILIGLKELRCFLDQSPQALRLKN